MWRHSSHYSFRLLLGLLYQKIPKEPHGWDLETLSEPAESTYVWPEFVLTVSLCVPLRSCDHHNPNLPVLLVYALTLPPKCQAWDTYTLISSTLPGIMVLCPLVHLEPCLKGFSWERRALVL